MNGNCPTCDRPYSVRQDGYDLDATRLIFTFEGKRIHLSRKEFAALSELMSSDRGCSRSDLESTIWPDDQPGSRERLSHLIQNLRIKLGGVPVRIRSAHGVGYYVEMRAA